MKSRMVTRIVAGICMLIGCIGFLSFGNFLSSGIFGFLAVVFFLSAFKGIK